jgi:hypothetical protein
MPQAAETSKAPAGGLPVRGNGAATTQDVRDAAMRIPVRAGATRQPVHDSAALTDEEILGIELDSGARRDGNAEPPLKAAVDEVEPAHGSAQGSQADRAGEREEGGLKPAPALAEPAATQEQTDAAQAFAELFPGGIESARAAAQGAGQLAKLDAAYFSGDAGKQSELAAYLYSAEPRAFAAMVEHAARVLAERDPAAFAAAARAFGAAPVAAGHSQPQDGAPKGAATQDETAIAQARAEIEQGRAQVTRERAEMDRERQQLRAERFTAFQRGANDSVVAEVRRTLDTTLARALPENASADARQRIARDIFMEVHHTLQADAALARQVGGVIANERYDEAARDQVAQLVLARARTVLPEVTRRVVGAWTSGVLSSHRERAGKQEAAALRIELTGGGAPESVPKRGLSQAELRRMSDEEILDF